MRAAARILSPPWLLHCASGHALRVRSRRSAPQGHPRSPVTVSGLNDAAVLDAGLLERLRRTHGRSGRVLGSERQGPNRRQHHQRCASPRTGLAALRGVGEGGFRSPLRSLPPKPASLFTQRLPPRPTTSPVAKPSPARVLPLRGNHAGAGLRLVADEGDFAGAFSWPAKPRSDHRGHVVLVDAPRLRPVDTPNGSFRWLQAMSIDGQELEALGSENYPARLQRIAQTNPLFVSPRRFEPRPTGASVTG